MKKIIISFLAGALIMASGQAIADTASRVGKKVVSEAKVTLNGNQLSDAIIVDGKSYAPVRDIAEAFGSDVTYSSRKGDKALIELKQNSKFPSAEEMKAQYEIEQKIIELNQEKADLERKLTDSKKSITNYETQIIPPLVEKSEKLDKDSSAYTISMDYIKQLQSTVKEKKEQAAQYETRIAEIDKRLAELESTK